MNIGVHRFFWTDVSGFLGYNPSSDIAGLKVPFLVLWGNSILFSTVAVPVCLPTNSVLRFPFLHNFASICCLLICLWWPFWLVWRGISSWFFKNFIFIFSETGEGMEKERESSMRGCLLHGPSLGPCLEPRHMSWLRLELLIFWFTGWPSIHWATAARAHCGFSLYPSDCYWCWASFHMSLGPLYVLLAEMSVQVLCPFFNWIVCLSGDLIYLGPLFFLMSLVKCLSI